MAFHLSVPLSLNWKLRHREANTEAATRHFDFENTSPWLCPETERKTLSAWSRKLRSTKLNSEKQWDKVSSKNSLESYALNMKATVEDEKLQGKINDEDKQKILDKCNEIINWLDKNQTAEKEESEHQQKKLEKVCNPIITKLYQSAGGMPGGMPGGFPGGGAAPSGGASSGPTIEEVDEANLRIGLALFHIKYSKDPNL
ncbi:heat shock cognate 71 kDa protein-like [Mirounga leonina]|uniref:heat shock cognate 71 kDa protein-like n=1 Tax=Mirounga leonina TaxID=9715 RepID=UPI00156BEA02|nr:heat shock cognate 71 kDa protein-like [Mirounga leonina]